MQMRGKERGKALRALIWASARKEALFPEIEMAREGADRAGGVWSLILDRSMPLDRQGRGAKDFWISRQETDTGRWYLEP